MKKRRLLFVIIITIIILIVVLPIGNSVRNNLLLNKYAAQLYSIPLPRDTLLIGNNKNVGNLYGTGNHLDFVATIEIKTSLPENELYAYYNNMHTKIRSVEELSLFEMGTYPDLTINHHVQNIEVIPKAQAKLIYGSSCILGKSDIVDKNIDETLFIIQIKDTHYGSDLDWRTH